MIQLGLWVVPVNDRPLMIQVRKESGRTMSRATRLVFDAQCVPCQDDFHLLSMMTNVRLERNVQTIRFLIAVVIPDVGVVYMSCSLPCSGYICFASG